MPTPHADGGQPGYEVTITDDTNTVGLRLASPQSIRQLPRGLGVQRKEVSQKSWVSGRGGIDFASDTARFYDSGRCWSMNDGYLISGPLCKYATGHRLLSQAMPGNVTWEALTGATPYIARSFVATAFTTTNGSVILRRVGTPATLTIQLMSNVGGVPTAVLASASVTVNDITDWVSEVWPFLWNAGYLLVLGTTYWIVITTAAGAISSHWEVGCDASSSAGKSSADGAVWVADSAPYYRVLPTTTQKVHQFFHYKTAVYFVTRPASGASALYLNGDRGVATGVQAAGTLIDTTKAWTANEWAGCVVYLSGGTGISQSRLIASNTGNTLTLSAAWDIVPVNAVTEYVILGSDKWTAVTATLATPVTSVCVTNGIVYFALGDNTNMRRLREYNNAGVWTRQNADDGTNKAHLLMAIGNQDGDLHVYRANNVDAAGTTVLSTVSFAPPVAWGANLDFTGVAHSGQVGDLDSRITGMTLYNGMTWIGKEDSIYEESDAAADKWLIVLPQMRQVRDPRNNARMTGWNLNLYFTFQNGLERMYGTTIDDIGPNRDAGMPETKRGWMTDFLPVLQRGVGAYMGDTGKRSSVLCTTYPGGDWHELHGGAVDEQINYIFYENIPLVANKLWVSQGADVVYLTMPDEVTNPLTDAGMRYTWEAYMTTAWIDVDSPELDKLFDELRLYTENLSASDGRMVEVDYQTNGDGDTTTWRRFTNPFTTSPFEHLTVGDGYVTGWRARFRLRLITTNASLPIVVTAMTLRANQVNEALYDYVLDIKLEDRAMLMYGSNATEEVMDIVRQLLVWQETATPLTLSCAVEAFDGVRGHIDPISLIPRTWEPEISGLAGSITFKVASRNEAGVTIVTGDTVRVGADDVLSCCRFLVVDGTLIIDGWVSVWG